MNGSEPNYPGQGHPWADFLHHRARALVMLENEGRSPEYIAQIMSMDPDQVCLILTSQKEPKDPNNLGQCSVCRQDQLGSYHTHPCE